MLHNLIVICPVNATYISNCYMCPARLFIKCGAEIHLKRVQHKVIQHRWINGLFIECGAELHLNRVQHKLIQHRWIDGLFIECGAELHVKRVQQKLIQHRWIDGLFIECGAELHLNRVQHKLIQHRWVLLLTGYFHCFSFYLTLFPSTNSTPNRFLMLMTLQLLANYQPIKTTGAN